VFAHIISEVFKEMGGKYEDVAQELKLSIEEFEQEKLKEKIKEKLEETEVCEHMHMEVYIGGTPQDGDYLSGTVSQCGDTPENIDILNIEQITEQRYKAQVRFDLNSYVVISDYPHYPLSEEKEFELDIECILDIKIEDNKIVDIEISNIKIGNIDWEQLNDYDDNKQEKIEAIIPTSKRFQMGSKDGDSDEKPVHEVVFNYDFEIAKYSVTVGEFRAFVKETGYKTEAELGDGAYVWDGKDWDRRKDAYWDNPYFEQTDKHPVVCVCWHDAKEYCEWLSKKTGENYRLPTEAEWEYACRAGTTTKWSFGDDEKELDKYTWYHDNSDGKTHIVGEKEPNPWGLYDMHGNVWEWCEDWYDEDKDTKVLRGGSWYNFADLSRSAYRSWSDPTVRFNGRGFRLIRTLSSDLGDIVTNTTVKKSKKTVPKGDVTFKCEKCSTSYALNCDELDWQQVNGSERNMGAELEHQAEYFNDCDNCGNEMLITLSCWEYPIGAENYRDVNGEGVKDIKGNCCLDFHESDRMEYIYNSVEEIKKWFFENYEDPANSLPYVSKEGGYQWIHGGPVDTEEAIYEHFGEISNEDILNKAIDEIGRYEEWSPIPQSEEEFQNALSNWAKKKADEDES
jgi:formylglycine-generating enzyme required for sulfatase activity